MQRVYRKTEKKLGIDQIDHEPYHHLFLLRITLSDEESECRETGIIDLHFAIFLESVTIFLEKPHEEECSYPLVPISKRVILDDEVEEVCCLLFDGRIEVYSIECRDDRGEDTDETL